jgi:hypothetical protein
MKTTIVMALLAVAGCGGPQAQAESLPAPSSPSAPAPGPDAMSLAGSVSPVTPRVVPHSRDSSRA